MATSNRKVTLSNISHLHDGVVVFLLIDANGDFWVLRCASFKFDLGLTISAGLDIEDHRTCQQLIALRRLRLHELVFRSHLKILDA